MQSMQYILLLLYAYEMFAQSELPTEESEDEYKLYEAFKQKYGKVFKGDENRERYAIFKQNLRKAEEYQRMDRGTATYGVTKFFDLTAEEFKKLYLTALSPGSDDSIPLLQHEKVGQLPEFMDWREYGAVGPVRNQGTCGSCWAFSVVQNIEGQWFMKIRQLLILSVQQLVDCDYRDMGCGGGYPSFAYEAVRHFGGLELAVDYPYVGYQQYCLMNPQQFVAYINGSVRLPKDPERIADYLARYGPLSVLINGGPLQYYTSGVLDLPAPYCDPAGLDHAVLSVGFGTEQDAPYWIMKNTWGTDWGLEGYFHIYRGENTCGIDEYVSSATVYR